MFVGSRASGVNKYLLPYNDRLLSFLKRQCLHSWRNCFSFVVDWRCCLSVCLSVCLSIAVCLVGWLAGCPNRFPDHLRNLIKYKARNSIITVLAVRLAIIGLQLFIHV